MKVADWRPLPEDDRPDGYRVLAFHRGRWRDVRWGKDHGMWFYEYGGGGFRDMNRKFAPLPPLPEDAGDFYEWKR